MSGKLLTLIGPTASGKTALACELADRFPVDLISVDSAQIYRGMNIGTAKPEPDFLARYPHQLIDILDPEESYSAAQFCYDAHALIAQSHQAGRLPLLVGGTMLYYLALFAGLSDLPSADPVLRETLEQRMKTQGLPSLYQELARRDPMQARKLSENDPQRILRSLELIALTGKTPTELYREQAQQRPDWLGLHLGLLPERAILHQRIEQRFRQMIATGFIEEVQQLRQRPALTAGHPSMRSVGYRQLWQYLEGEIAHDQAIEQGIIATRQLAKRQITWMNNRLRESMMPILFNPLAVHSREQLLARVDQFLST